MAGSYKHVSKHKEHPHGYRGRDLLDNMGDAVESIDELWFLVRYLAGDNDEIVLAALEQFYRPDTDLARTIHHRIAEWVPVD